MSQKRWLASADIIVRHEPEVPTVQSGPSTRDCPPQHETVVERGSIVGGQLPPNEPSIMADDQF